jgi:hypothetical protein
MLLDSLNGDSHRFNHVFNDAKILGAWVEKSDAFQKYIKKSMLGSLIASRFVEPNIEQKIIDFKLNEPKIFHNIESLEPCWRANEELKFENLIKLMFNRVLEKFKTKCEINTA